MSLYVVRKREKMPIQCRGVVHTQGQQTSRKVILNCVHRVITVTVEIRSDSDTNGWIFAQAADDRGSLGLKLNDCSSEFLVNRKTNEAFRWIFWDTVPASFSEPSPLYLKAL